MFAVYQFAFGEFRKERKHSILHELPLANFAQKLSDFVFAICFIMLVCMIGFSVVFLQRINIVVSGLTIYYTTSGARRQAIA